MDDSGSEVKWCERKTMLCGHGHSAGIAALKPCSVPVNRVREVNDRPATDAMSEQLSLNFDEAPDALSGMALWREMRLSEILIHLDGTRD